MKSPEAPALLHSLTGHPAFHAMLMGVTLFPVNAKRNRRRKLKRLAAARRKA